MMPYTCPGCGTGLPEAPPTPQAWTDAPYWCTACGGTGHGYTPARDPRWYALVAAEFDVISPMMPLVADVDTIAPLFEQARCGAEATVMEPMSDDEETTLREAARRTAHAVALLAYGGGWDPYAETE